MAECRTLLALLSLAAVLLLLARALPFHRHYNSAPRLRGAALADLLLAALDRLDGLSLVGLATRRNMVLLCHAILLLVLRDAGLLSARARRHGHADTAAFTAAGASRARAPAINVASTRRYHTSTVVVWRRPRDRAALAPHAAKNAKADAIGHLKRQRRGARLTEEASLAEPGHQEEPAATTEEVLLRGKQMTYLAAGELDQAAATHGNMTSRSDFGLATVVADHEERTRAADGDTEECSEEDLDEMNRRFDEFIANTRKKMELEAMQLVHVSAQNTRLLA